MIVEGGFGNGASVFTGVLLGEPGGENEGSGDEHLFPWGPREPGRGIICRGLCVEEGSAMGVSPCRDTLGNLGRGSISREL